MTATGPFKVTQGHRFWHQSKARQVCDLLLLNNAILYPISHRFQLSLHIGQIIAFDTGAFI